MAYFFNSIRSRVLTYFLPLIIVTVAGVSFFNYVEIDKVFNKNYQDIKKQLEHNIVNEILLIDASYRMLETVLEKRLAEQTPAILEAYEKAGRNPANMDLEAIKTKLNISVLYIVNDKGIITHATDKSALNFDFGTYGLAEKIEEVRLSNKPKFERIIINTLSGSLGIWIYQSTPDNKYVLEWGYEQADLSEIVKELDWLKAVEALRKDSPLVKRIRMFDCFAEEFVEGGGTKHKPTAESKEIVRIATEKKRVELDSSGNDVTYIFVDIAKIKQGLANPSKIVEITYDTQAIKAELRKAAFLNIFYIILSVIITFFVVYFISHVLSSPIENLQKITEKIAKSENYDQEIPVLSSDEVGQLAASFGIMMKKIKHSYAVLEDKVVERTYHLNLANEDLKQTNEELAATIELVQIQKKEIESKNKNITSSINYARRIQRAILPPDEKMNNLFPKNFILNMPRDIVSGDFYFAETHLGKTFLVVADCTGHGIPGGFMSMIGSQLLYEIILVKDIISPDIILNELNKNVIRVLQQDINDSRDGMDISIIVVDLVYQIVELANAMNPIYVINSNKELEEFKADKMPIGGANLLYKNRLFSKRTITLNPENPMLFYLCSDGYQDQFGGENSKKFMSKNLKNLLVSIADKPMLEQGKLLETNIEAWRNYLEQTDDILVIGVKI